MDRSGRRPVLDRPTVLTRAGQAVAFGSRVDSGAWRPAQATNAFAGQTVDTIVLEVPDELLLPVLAVDRRFSVWALTSLATDTGGWRPINRAGHPMIHPLFAQHDEQLGDRLNATEPAADDTNYSKHVADAVAGVVSAYGVWLILGPMARRSRRVSWRTCCPTLMFTPATNMPLTTGLDKGA
ncbi:DUF4331 domain-containing protein [Actinoplanes sp. TBRC 11911]|uniref:DUF4331 family protein n=1 Tax=Actinoplanes sp. TBRC 11911 TaxID=2729386 RepID=UPI00145EF699|nr:DUF4331 family protein [Actinoplanes sp. TBRC 11911]NMO55335.1 DUF4331 domain-containing protein [Actinoplanes sp. TBRC 11911]